MRRNDEESPLPSIDLENSWNTAESPEPETCNWNSGLLRLATGGRWGAYYIRMSRRNRLVSEQ